MNTSPTNSFRKAKALPGSTHLFREAYKTFLEALFCLWRIELPAAWRRFKDNNIAAFHENVAENERDAVGDVLSVFMLTMLMVFALGVAWVIWILKH